MSSSIGAGRPPAPEAPQAEKTREPVEERHASQSPGSVAAASFRPYRLFIPLWCSAPSAMLAPSRGNDPTTSRSLHFDTGVFTLFGEPLFRRAEPTMPVMVVRLGDRDAAIPLRSLAREFSIADDSADGQMLA